MQRVRKYRWWVVLIAFLMIAISLSSQDGTQTVQTSMFVTEGIAKFLKIFGITEDMEYLHLKVRLCAHFIVYIVIGFILCKAMMSTSWRKPILKSWIIGCIIGILDEVHKVFIPGRCCDVSEIFINCLCVTAVCTVIHLRNRTKSRNN